MPLQTTPISVSLQDVKAHLLVMTAFQRVHELVEKDGIRLDLATGLPIPTPPTIMFLARSLQRFEAWITTLSPDISESGLKDYEIPPLDVLMFLHAYMLSPLDFYEDSISRHKILTRLGEFPLSRIAALIDKETLELKPIVEQVAYWEKATKLAFEIPFADQGSETFTATCPRCETKASIPWTEVKVSKAPLSPVEYPSIEFKTDCANCGLGVSPSAIRAGRFLRDIYQTRVSHTILDHTNSVPDFPAAKAASLEFTTVLDQDPAIPQKSGDAFNWNIERLFDYLKGQLDADSRLQDVLLDIKESYSHPNNFAINLSDAVLRQARFIFKMSAMGWLEPGKFDNEHSALLQAMRNYELLLRVNTDGMIVKWDVDLIFHTHQLLGPRYRSETLRIMGRVLDHDDKQPLDVIKRASERAEAVWKDAFGESYFVPNNGVSISDLARTVCGNADNGACLTNGGKGDGQTGGGKGTHRALVSNQTSFAKSYLVPNDGVSISDLARTVCGGSDGGACVTGGGKGDGQKSGGKDTQLILAYTEANREVLVQ